MSAHNVIVLSSPAEGRFIEGTLDEAATPGMIMEVKPGVAADGSGRLTYRKATPGGDGLRTPILVLREDLFTGRTKETAYAAGDRCYLYAPKLGDELQVLLKNESGTGENIAVGDKLIVDDGTGLVIETTGSPESEPFQAMEAISAITANTHIHVMYTGH